jgi:hypothetical protein
VPPLQLFDSSVLIPWLRTLHYDALVTTAFASRLFLLSTVVWMELYDGTRSRGDKQDLDREGDAILAHGPEPLHIRDVTLQPPVGERLPASVGVFSGGCLPART